MEPIEFFYFDLGQVIYFFDYKISILKAAKLVNCPEANIFQAIYESGLEELFETGVISETRFVAEIERCLGRSVDCPAFLEATSAMFTFNLEILQVIDWLERKSIPYGLLSNTCSSHWSWISRQGDIDFRKFRHLVVSYEVGCMKPAAAIYAVCESKAGVPANRIAFIDDREANIQAAQQRGWQTLLFRDVSSTMYWLQQTEPS